MGSTSWEKDNLPSSSAPTSVPETLEIELPVTLCNRILTIAASDTAEDSGNPYQDIFSEIVDAISAATTTEDEVPGAPNGFMDHIEGQTTTA